MASLRPYGPRCDVSGCTERASNELLDRRNVTVGVFCDRHAPRRELELTAEERREDGLCGDECLGRFCVFPNGHPGKHAGADGSEWLLPARVRIERQPDGTLAEVRVRSKRGA